MHTLRYDLIRPLVLNDINFMMLFRSNSCKQFVNRIAYSALDSKSFLLTNDFCRSYELGRYYGKFFLTKYAMDLWIIIDKSTMKATTSQSVSFWGKSTLLKAKAR